MKAKTLPDASAIFGCFSASKNDPKTLLLDVRPQKQWQKSHIALSYSIRLSANGRALLVSDRASVLKGASLPGDAIQQMRQLTP
jgi:hypothetical protein